MLYGRHVLPTIPASDLARARAWYADKLGFAAGQEEAAALLYRRGEERLFLLFSSPGAGTAHHQLAAWVVEDLAAEVAELRARGVEFEEYDEPGLRTVDGIAVTPVGTAAWFKDSEGNVLTITQLDNGTTEAENSGSGIADRARR
jgi:catechol 2,3-dioxygenase-like lactoylglutathione lyase family enzyme